MCFEALNHLMVLERLDHAVFQVVPEREGCQLPERVIVGAYSAVGDELASLNAQGCAIHIQVHGRARGDRAVKRVTWLYLDFDDRDVVPIFPLRPHLIVRTARGFHAYWRIAPSRDLKLWKAVQGKMRSDHGACERVKALSQVLRLAGSVHHKGMPTEVSIHDWSPGLSDYLLSEFVERYDVLPVNALPTTANVCIGPLLRDLQRTTSKEVCRKFFPLVLQMLDRQVLLVVKASRGNRHATVRDTAFCLGHYIHWGLDPERAFNRLVKAAEAHGWTDRDLRSERLRDAIYTGLRKGYKDGPPTLSDDDAAELAQFVARERLREQVRVLAPSLPDSVTTEQIYLQLEGRDAWGTQKQASHQIASILLQEGYVRRATRYKGRTVYERSVVIHQMKVA